MLTKYVALVSQSHNVQMPELAEIAAALQKQLTRDFTPIWNIPATIAAFSSLEDVPSDYWKIIISDDVEGSKGCHDSNGQPFALVSSMFNVPAVCSHELIEMLVDPWGNRFVASESLQQGQGRVNYLVEACDPCSHVAFGYKINGIDVSDFYTPQYFDPVHNAATRYSYNGSITKPREVLNGGYITWMVPETQEWWQAINNGTSLNIVNHGQLQLTKCGWRGVIDRMTNNLASKDIAHSNEPQHIAAGLKLPSHKTASGSLAKLLLADIEKLLNTEKALV